VRARRLASCLFLLATLLPTGGCGIMQANGPASWDVRAGQRDPEALPYALVRVTPPVINVLASATPRLATAFTDQRPPEKLRFGIGDVVSVTIFEAAAGGLFIPAEAGVRPGNFVTLPSQAVDPNGNLTIPYAGQIRAKDRTQIEVQDDIVNKLKNRAIEPQVVISLVEQRSRLIDVLGDVRSAGRIPVIPAGEHILDTITRAGGTISPGADEWVILERSGRRAVAPFGALVYEPANNIWAHAGDTLYIYREPQTYLALGATGVQSQIPFDAWRLSLAEAVAKAGGLSDAFADPAAVFLYRGETCDIAENLGIDCSKFQGPIIPVIYNLNFRDPAGYFLATKFEMRNKDVVYISNSVAVEITKVLALINSINSTLSGGITTAIDAISLKNAAKGVSSPSILIGASPIATTGTP
jgi:polysaccharide biosynthesis/export protein